MGLMKLNRAAGILALFLIIQLLAACSGASSNSSNSGSTAAAPNTDNSNSARTNVEELGILVNMPFETEETVWKEYPSQKKLLAVLRFSPADANKAVEQAGKFRQPHSVTVSSENWFPPELIAQSEMSGDDTLKGTSYAANDFFQPPYNDGQITRINDSDYFVLELNAK
jgi:uncharacterized lipoprotein